MPTQSRVFAYIRRIALIWLAANVCIASIPRCNALFSAWLNSAPVEEHCHAAPDPQLPALHAGHLCQCSLLSFVFSSVQWQDPRHEIQAPASRASLISFVYQPQASELDLDIESPPPKA